MPEDRGTILRNAPGGQLARALTLAAQKLEPKVQPLSSPRRILRDEADLDAWLTETRQLIANKLNESQVKI